MQIHINTSGSSSSSSTGIRWLITQKAFEYLICKSAQIVYCYISQLKDLLELFSRQQAGSDSLRQEPKR